MPKDTILTPQGLEDLKTELEELTTSRRREVAERIKEAREYGDISENSEYDDAKNEQAMLESRIALLEERIRSAQVVDATELSTDSVQVGMTVTFTDTGSGKPSTFTIVGAAEANSAERKLSNESPVGRALLGRRAGDTVSVSLPNGSTRQLQVDKIEIAG
jgi:transcription elongation factor GreA